jgi:hypothetical protein
VTERQIAISLARRTVLWCPSPDVTDGIRTRALLRAHDPRLARILKAAYGDGAWRYPHTAPKPFQEHAGAAKSRSAHALSQIWKGGGGPSDRGRAS